MTRILIQAALSVMVALGLTAGTSPEVRSKARKTLLETKAVVEQAVEFATHSLKSDVEAEAVLETDRNGKKRNAKLEAESEVTAGAESNFEWDTYLEELFGSEAGVAGEATVELDVEASAIGDRFELDLSNETEGELDLELDFGE
jgi:hypothetical protein